MLPELVYAYKFRFNEPNILNFRDLPFHHSQREIASGEDWTDFEYLLRISSDFYTPLLSRGPNIKVLQPEWLAEEIRQQHLKALGLYEEICSHCINNE